MKPRSPIDAQLIERFVHAQSFRSDSRTRLYRSTLSDFYDFIRRGGDLADVSCVRQWLQHAKRIWKPRMVCGRACILERFLHWSQAQGVIPRSPFTSLHRDYGPHTRCIVQALLSKDLHAALEKLRPLPRFGSFLGPLMQEHVTQMRSLGMRYECNERMLLRFDRFLQAHCEWADLPLVQLVQRWSQARPTAQHLWEAQQVGRLISKAMHRRDPGVAILSVGAGVEQRRRQQQRRPYIYSDEQIQRLLQAAQSFPSPRAPLRPLSLYTMLLLAYCAGLRVREIQLLTFRDVCLQDGTIEIRETKFFKHRRLPLAPGVMTALKAYLLARQKTGAPLSLDSRVFCDARSGAGYSYGGLRSLLLRVLRRARLKPARGKVGPRIHDLRHTMASHRLRNWYRDGIDPQSKLPYLVTYLGHKDIHSTLHYLNPTPEVLREASERFRARGAAAVPAHGEHP